MRLYLILIFLASAATSLSAFPSTETECFKQAKLIPEMSDSQAIELCANAKSSAPVDCFKSVTTLNLYKISKSNAVKVCQFANTSSRAPFCVKDAIEMQRLSESQAVDLCRIRCSMPE